MVTEFRIYRNGTKDMESVILRSESGFSKCGYKSYWGASVFQVISVCFPSVIGDAGVKNPKCTIMRVRVIYAPQPQPHWLFSFFPFHPVFKILPAGRRFGCSPWFEWLPRAHVHKGDVPQHRAHSRLWIGAHQSLPSTVDGRNVSCLCRAGGGVRGCLHDGVNKHLTRTWGEAVGTHAHRKGCSAFVGKNHAVKIYARMDVLILYITFARIVCRLNSSLEKDFIFY